MARPRWPSEPNELIETPILGDHYLLNQLEFAKTVVTKTVELHEVYKFDYTPLTRFGLV
jgi:hypothetical protein